MADGGQAEVDRGTPWIGRETDVGVIFVRQFHEVAVKGI